MRVTFGSNALTPAHTAYLPRDSSASPTLIAAARLVRVHVLLEMSNTKVVSTDCPIPITRFTPDALSVSVPPVVVIWIPLPPGHPAIVPLTESLSAGTTEGMGVGRGGVGVCALEVVVPIAVAIRASVA
ncbi:MAG TPA: hypothetical protein VE967_16390 [Gemmatimonadaceae bacterium]|nr:hypothetical protein [Gemmatimonadaceae bacterium]